MSELPMSPRMYATLIMQRLALPLELDDGTMQDYLTDMIERAIADHNRVLVETTLAQRQALKSEVDPREYPSDHPAPGDLGSIPL